MQGYWTLGNKLQWNVNRNSSIFIHENALKISSEYGNHIVSASLEPSDAIWRQRSGSTLAQVMAWCLTAPSHYLNQCWLNISKVEWHSSKASSRETSTVYWCIASKWKVPLIFMEWTKRVVGGFITFQSVLLWWYYNNKKGLPDIGGTTIQDVGPPAAMRAAMEPGVHTMSDELTLQISCNIFLAFKWILMMRSG